MLVRAISASTTMPIPSSALSDRFRTFADSECKDSSPLYYALSHATAQDAELIEVTGWAASGQPVPNLFFASVHYLLLTGTAHPVASFYPTLAESAGSPTEAFPHFKDFVLRHREAIVSLLKSRLVQTNEVRRSAYLFPALAFAASHFEAGRPMALLEIGTSAGLNLLWDKYRYTYGDSMIHGDSSSQVLIRSSFRGKSPSVLAQPWPKVSHRIGLDLNVVDTACPDQSAWLRALIWPEHHERMILLESALAKRDEETLDLRNGDGFAMVSGIAEEISEDSLLCVYHTHVANQISSEARQDFLQCIEQLGAKRDVVHICNNIKPNLHLTAYNKGQLLDMPLANTDGHARWIEWLQE